MKCQAQEIGFLKDPDNPSWTCSNEAEAEIELKFKNGAIIIKGDVCKKCAESILRYIAKSNLKSANLKFIEAP